MMSDKKSYGILRVDRVKEVGSMIGLQNHIDRKGKNHSNKDIDLEKSHLNYDVIKFDENNFINRLTDRIEEGYNGKRKIRSDAIRLVDGFIGASPEFFKNISKEEQEKFFKDSTDFIKGWYGEKNIIYGKVHLDEKTPHLHFGFVPLTEDGRLSAKEVLGGKKKMTELQDNFHDYMTERGHDLERGKRSVDTGRIHKSVEELKLETQEEAEKLTLENEKLKEENRDLQEKIKERDEIKVEVNVLKNTKDALEDEIEPLKDDLEQLKTIKRDKLVEQDELDSIKGRRKALREREKEEKEAYKENRKKYKKREEEAKKQAEEAESRLRKIESAVEEKLDDYSYRLSVGIENLQEQANEIYQDFYSSAEDTLAIVKSWFKRNEVDFEELVEEEIENQIDDVQEPNLGDIDQFYGSDDELEL